MIIDREIEDRVKAKTEELLKKESLTLVEFKLFFRRPSSYVVRVVADYFQGGITIADCAKLNKLLFSYLDREKVIGDDFVIEVISPGLDRKLTTKSDFLRVKDSVVCVWLEESVKGKQYWEGNILEIKDKSIVLNDKKGSVEIPLELIKFGKQNIEIK